MHVCLLFSPIIVWIEKLKTEAEISSAWVYEICLLGKSLFTSMSFCYQLLLKNISVSTTFHLFLFGDFLFTGCEWKQVATTGRSFCSCSCFAFPCTCTGSAAHDCMPREWRWSEILRVHLHLQVESSSGLEVAL